MPVTVDSRYRGILTALGWGATPRWAIDIAIGVIDLAMLEGRNMPGKVRIPCANARRPDPWANGPAARDCRYSSRRRLGGAGEPRDGKPPRDCPL